MERILIEGKRLGLPNAISKYILFGIFIYIRLHPKCRQYFTSTVSLCLQLAAFFLSK